jgi:signal transduction histidine kinase
MALVRRNRNPQGYWLLIIAVLIFAASFLVRTMVVSRISLKHQSEFFEKGIKERVEDFKKNLTDTMLVNRILTGNNSFEDVKYLFNKPYYTYLYDVSDDRELLRFWSTALVLPPDSLLNDHYTEDFIHLSNGYYYIMRDTVPGHPEFRAYCMILIKSAFFISTDYLRESFPFNTGLDDIVDLSLEPTPFPVKSEVGKTLFYLKYKPNASIKDDNALSVTMRIIGLFLIFLSFYLLLHRRIRKRETRFEILSFTSCLLGFRIALYVLRPYLNLERFGLFDPAVYGSSFLLPSLGDLLINSILFCWITIFAWTRLHAHKFRVRSFSKKRQWLVGLLSLVLLVSTTFLITNVIKSLISDSKISFDVTNFFSLDLIYTSIGFIILACLSLGFFYFSQILYKYIFSIYHKRIATVYILVAVTGLFLITVFATRESVNFYLPCLAWLLIYTFFFENQERINKTLKFNTSGIIFWIFMCSLSISFLMLSEIRKSELTLRKLYAEKLATQTDPASERLVNLANKYMDNNFFRRNFYRLYDESDNQKIRDSVKERNYIGYLNNYNTDIYFFDSVGHPLYNPTSLSLASFNNIITRQSNPTQVPDLYFYETDFDKFVYVTQRVIKNEDDKIIGNVFIISDPKKFSGTNINPELFKQFRQWELANSSVYYYAVYTNKLLSASSKKYPFTSTLLPAQLPSHRFEVRKREDFNELWYRASDSKVIVLARKNEVVLETITLFSYIFCSFLLVVALIQGLSQLLGRALKRNLLNRKMLAATSIRGQIHSTFSLVTILSFLVVGVATISYFVNRFESVNNERLSRTMNIMLNEMQTHKELASLIYDSRLGRDSTDEAPLMDIIKRLSAIHGVDVNIYDYSGRLLASSQPDIYDKGVWSKQMGPRAYFNLLRLRKIEYIQKERVSDLSYWSIYSPVRDEKGAFFAYLSIPYFTSQQELNQEISNFLVTLINLIAFIFLITGMVALFITNRITRSLMLIGEQMKKISLSEDNQHIAWKGDDEIGLLVSEYNRMVDKLQMSAGQMARSEREGAWREMARQVAHEIKNPLTPMKLSLQYLQKAIREDSPNTRQLTNNVSRTLVEQIDHLSKIAADFSQFANINNIDPVVFDLNEVLQSLKVMYSKNEDVDFVMQTVPGPVMVLADRTHINRVFTNLFVNAIDACRGETGSRIEVQERVDDKNVIISVTDNGQGIPEDMRTRIFTPYFTTKSSGTGLGLAMSKQILDQIGGDIRFETKTGFGTTFIVTLPLAESDGLSAFLGLNEGLE